MTSYVMKVIYKHYIILQTSSYSVRVDCYIWTKFAAERYTPGDILLAYGFLIHKTVAMDTRKILDVYNNSINGTTSRRKSLLSSG